jgi:hypothetical protein
MFSVILEDVKNMITVVLLCTNLIHAAKYCPQCALPLINLLKAYCLRNAPTGLRIFKNRVFCPHCIYAFCIYLRTNSDLCHLQHKLIGFYNRDEKCLQRGTDWVFNKAVCASSLQG